jgi:hypothetical protein
VFVYCIYRVANRKWFAAGTPMRSAISPSAKPRRTRFLAARYSRRDLMLITHQYRTYVRQHSCRSRRKVGFAGLQSDWARAWWNGRHAGFRCRCSKERGGSNPSARIAIRSPGRVAISLSARLAWLFSGQWPNWLRHRSPKPAIPGSSPGCPALSRSLSLDRHPQEGSRDRRGAVLARVLLVEQLLQLRLEIGLAAICSCRRERVHGRPVVALELSDKL